MGPMRARRSREGRTSHTLALRRPCSLWQRALSGAGRARRHGCRSRSGDGGRDSCTGTCPRALRRLPPLRAGRFWLHVRTFCAAASARCAPRGSAVSWALVGFPLCGEGAPLRLQRGSLRRKRAPLPHVGLRCGGRGCAAAPLRLRCGSRARAPGAALTRAAQPPLKECGVCCDEMNKGANLELVCQHCGFSACANCYKRVFRCGFSSLHARRAPAPGSRPGPRALGASRRTRRSSSRSLRSRATWRLEQHLTRSPPACACAATPPSLRRAWAPSAARYYLLTTCCKPFPLPT